MNERKPTKQKTITIDEVIENYKVLRLWHNAVCFISAFMICCMIGAVIWGIFNSELRFILRSAGIVPGICGAALFLVVHKLLIKTSYAVLDFFKTICKMPDSEVLEKARELKIPQKAIKNLSA